MNLTTLPKAADIQVLLNGKTVGALVSFSERCEQDVALLRGLGSSENSYFNCNGKRFTVELEFLLPLGCVLVDMPQDPILLTAFTLVVKFPGRTLRYADCIYETVQMSCQVGGSLVCRMKILARDRECGDETG